MDWVSVFGRTEEDHGGIIVESVVEPPDIVTVDDWLSVVDVVGGPDGARDIEVLEDEAVAPVCHVSGWLVVTLIISLEVESVPAELEELDELETPLQLETR